MLDVSEVGIGGLALTEAGPTRTQTRRALPEELRQSVHFCLRQPLGRLDLDWP